MKQQSIGCCIVTYFFDSCADLSRFVCARAHKTVLARLCCHADSLPDGLARPRARAVAKPIEKLRGCIWLSESKTEELGSLAKGGLPSA